MSVVSRFKNSEIIPHAVVNWLNDELPNIDGIFVVIKDKDGNFVEGICGNAGDLAFVALVLQAKALEAL